MNERAIGKVNGDDDFGRGADQTRMPSVAAENSKSIRCFNEAGRSQGTATKLATMGKSHLDSEAQSKELIKVEEAPSQHWCVLVDTPLAPHKGSTQLRHVCINNPNISRCSPCFRRKSVLGQNSRTEESSATNKIAKKNFNTPAEAKLG